MKALIDTNILVYAADPRDRERQRVAQRVLESLHSARIGALASQTLAEYSSVMNRKLGQRALGDLVTRLHEALDARFDYMKRAYDAMPAGTAAIVLEALRGAKDHQLSYFDAQMWATARLNQIPVLLSEDFRSGTVLEGVQFVNPFASGFSIERWA